MCRMLVLWVLLGLTTVAFAKNYVGFESSGVTQRGVNDDDDLFHWHPRLMFGHLNETNASVSNWRYGWEMGASYLKPGSNMVGKLSGFGADAFFVANNNFTGAWTLFYKLGASIEKLSLKNPSFHDREPVTSTGFHGVGKLGLEYQFKNGLGLFISENYQTKPLGNPAIFFYGFYTSVGMTYAF